MIYSYTYMRLCSVARFKKNRFNREPPPPQKKKQMRKKSTILNQNDRLLIYIKVPL